MGLCRVVTNNQFTLWVLKIGTHSQDCCHVMACGLHRVGCSMAPAALRLTVRTDQRIPLKVLRTLLFLAYLPVFIGYTSLQVCVAEVGAMHSNVVTERRGIHKYTLTNLVILSVL
jgi:hypothetical protein